MAPRQRLLSSNDAAAELGISRSRLLRLLGQDRVVGAQKIGRDWVVPSPVRLTVGKRGPEGVAGRRKTKSEKESV